MILHRWFHENHMILNPGKCHYIVIGDNRPSLKVILNDIEITRKCCKDSFRQQIEL